MQSLNLPNLSKLFTCMISLVKDSVIFFKELLLSVFISTIYVFCNSTSNLAKDSAVFPVTPGFGLIKNTNIIIGTTTLRCYSAVT